MRTGSPPLISIALCTYNGEKYLKEQLESLVKQDYSPFEIVVVDDGSRDNTIAIIKEFQEQYATIRFYENTNTLGYIKNFEKAISLCQGEYISLCDQDDAWRPQKLTLLTSNFLSNDLLVYHDSMLMDENGAFLNKTLSQSIGYLEGDNPYRALLINNCIAGHAMMFRKELVPHLFPIPEGIPHDHWIAYAASKMGAIKHVKEVLVNYRQHSTSMTSLLHFRQEKHKADPFTEKINKRTHINEERIRNLKALATFKGNSSEDLSFIQKLLKYLLNRDNQYFSLSMFLFLVKNQASLFQLYHRSWTSTVNLIYKESIGNPLKKLFHQ